jgi:hypothetical protein
VITRLELFSVYFSCLIFGPAHAAVVGLSRELSECRRNCAHAVPLCDLNVWLPSHGAVISLLAYFT